MIIDALTSWGKTKGIEETIFGVYDKKEVALSAYEEVGFRKNVIEMRIEIDWLKKKRA